MKTNNKIAIDSHNTISIEDLELILKTNCNAIINDPSMSKLIPPLLIHSSPGIGKSSVVKAVAEELGIGFVDIRLAQIESIDIRGLPSVDNEKGTMKWNAPDFWPRDPDSKGIIFFDEITAAPRDCQVASYEIILDRKIGEFYKIPDGWYIVAAGNGLLDHAVATTMSSALANRFDHVEIVADSDVWIKWAQLNNIHPSVTGYIGYRPMNLFNMEGENLERGWPSPRSWERVSQMVKVFYDNEHILRKLVYGLVGPAKGVEFMEFLKLNKKFDNVNDMLYGNIPVNIPTKNDEKYAFCSSLIYVLWKVKDEADISKRVDGFFNIIMDDNMTSDFSSMCLFGAMNSVPKDKKLKYHEYLYRSKKFSEWQKKHGSALNKHFSI